MTKTPFADAKFNTNIKGLPEGSYFTELGYSESYPWVEVSRTAKTVTVAEVLVKRDPEWKPNILPGGFVGHCDNQSEQTWLFDGVNHARTVTLRVRKSKYCGRDYAWGHGVHEFVANRAIYFYDYNF